MRSLARAIGALSLAVFVNSCDATGPAAAALADFLINYCGTAPAFLAIKNEGGDWTVVTLDANKKATVQVTKKFGYAEILLSSSGRYTTWVYYATTDEWEPFSSTCPTTPATKSVNGSIAGLSSQYTYGLSMRGSSTGGFTGNPTVSFTFSDLIDLPLDLVASLVSVNSPYLADKVVVRRAQNPAAGSTMAVVDFGSSEAIAPGSATLTYSNGAGAGETVYGATFFYSGTDNLLYLNAPITASSATFYGLPSATTLSTDRHVMDMYGYTPSTATAGSMQRGVSVYQQNLANVTTPLPANIATPTFTTVSTTPKRIRAQVPSSADLGAVTYVYFTQSASGTPRAGVAMTSGYLGGTPTTWDLEMPDLTDLAGYPTGANLPNAATNWSMWAANNSRGYFYGSAADVPAGTVINWAYRFSITATAALRAPGRVSDDVDLERPRMPGGQGFRTSPR